MVIQSGWMSWIGNVIFMGKMRNAYKILIGKSEGRIPLGKLHKLQHNVQMDLKCDDAD